MFFPFCRKRVSGSRNVNGTLPKTCICAEGCRRLFGVIAFIVWLYKQRWSIKWENVTVFPLQGFMFGKSGEILTMRLRSLSFRALLQQVWIMQWGCHESQMVFADLARYMLDFNCVIWRQEIQKHFSSTTNLEKNTTCLKISCHMELSSNSLVLKERHCKHAHFWHSNMHMVCSCLCVPRFLQDGQKFNLHLLKSYLFGYSNLNICTAIHIK